MDPVFSSNSACVLLSSLYYPFRRVKRSSLFPWETYWRTPGQTDPAQPCCPLAVLSHSIASLLCGIGDQLTQCRAYGTQPLIWVGGATHSLTIKKENGNQ